MPSEPTPAGPWSTAVSWIAMVLACGATVAVALFISADRVRYTAMFRDFKVELPDATRWFLTVPEPLLLAIAALMAGTSVAAQCVRIRRGGAASVHMVVLLCAAVAFGCYSQAMLRPFSSILWSVSGPSKR